MINLDALKLFDLFPKRISDEYMEALAYALDTELQEITAAIKEIAIMTRIMELPEDLVDLLAWQLHVDFYEPLGLSLDKKRALVQNSLLWHMHKGTKYILEDMIRILFFDDFSIEEWFEYDGDPYYFRLISSDTLTDLLQYTDLIRAIFELKNERSWLEGIRFNRETQATIHVGQVGRHTRQYAIRGIAPETKMANPIVYVGIVGKQVSRFSVDGTLPQQSQVQPTIIYMGAAGKQSRRYAIAGAQPTTDVADTVIHKGMANKNISRTFIGSSEEV